jgi:phosphoserine phosphatase
MFVMVDKEWAKRFHEELEEDAKERVWNILTDEEKKIVNDYKFYKDV